MEKQKKAEEEFHLKIFQKCYPDFPTGKINISETPDFLVKTSRNVIGIENTMLFKQEIEEAFSLQSIESTYRKILDNACEIYKKSGLPPVKVQVLFSNFKKIKKSGFVRAGFARGQVNQVSHQLGQRVIDYSRRHQNTNFSELTRLISDEENIEGISNIFVSLNIFNGINTLRNNRWLPIQSNSVKTDCINEIQNSIDKKNKKYQNYLKKSDECWLLLVANRNNPSQSFRIGKKAKQHVYDSLFERTFFLEIEHKDLVQLKCRKLAN